MARISVEQKALTDHRFSALGVLLGAEQHVAMALGLWVSLHVWNVCQERGVYVLSRPELDAIGWALGVKELALSMDKVGLGVALKRGRIRIKGTRGRVEWLVNRRGDGKSGGRPRKTLGLTVGLYEKHPGNNPPTPTPTPTPTPDPEEVPGISGGDGESFTAPRCEADSATPPVYVAPCTAGKAWPITQAQLDRWGELYPATNVDQEIRAAIGWLEANPRNRKTHAGAARFFANWLARAQNGSRADRGQRSPAQDKIARSIEASKRFLERSEP